MDLTWNYTDTRAYRRHIAEGMPPVIITCAVSGDYQKSQNPNIPVTAEEQAQEAANVLAAGASIIHIHGREAHDSTITSSNPERYYQINAMMRAKAPDASRHRRAFGESPRGREGFRCHQQFRQLRQYRYPHRSQRERSFS